MKQKGDIILLLPGEESWQAWRGQANSLTPIDSPSPQLAISQFTQLPQGPLALAFPVNQLTFAPFVAETNDPSLFDDLVHSHMESLSLRPNPEGGQLTDFFAIPSGQVNTTLVPVLLATQDETSLPPRPPQHFDISPNFFASPDVTIAFWKELGQWVMAIFSQSIPAYAQVLGSELSSDAAREARLASFQLLMQGVIPSAPARAILYTSAPDSLQPSSFSAEFPDLEILPRPTPTLPANWSRFLPADVGAERRRRAKRQKIILAALLALCALAIIATWQYNQVATLRNEVLSLQSRVNSNKPEVEALANIKARHEALGPVASSDLWPEDILLKIAQCLPADNTVRFTKFELSPDKDGILESVSIRGESTNNENITTFQQKLKNSMRGLKWSAGLPKAENSGMFSFDMNATRNPQ